MIDIRIRRLNSLIEPYRPYADVVVMTGPAKFELGLLDADEAKDLIASLQGAIDELKWIFPEETADEDD